VTNLQLASPIFLANIEISKDADGRFCLNDLHRASGGAKRHQPSNWLRLDQTKELIEELRKSLNLSVPGIPGTERIKDLEPVVTARGFVDQGTFVTKELVYAYAMWVSPAFNLRVIRTFDKWVAQQVQDLTRSLDQARTQLALPDPAEFVPVKRVRELEDHVSALQGTLYRKRQTAEQRARFKREFETWAARNGVPMAKPSGYVADVFLSRKQLLEYFELEDTPGNMERLYDKMDTLKWLGASYAGELGFLHDTIFLRNYWKSFMQKDSLDDIPERWRFLFRLKG
jgi:hypothetical protein